jgi:hypothetical protein
MNRDHLTARVIDASTGEHLEGVPSYTLYEKARNGADVHARHYEGGWVYCAPRDLKWHARYGHEPRLVRIERSAP